MANQGWLTREVSDKRFRIFFYKKAEQKIEIKMDKKYKVDEKGFYGQFGGAYVPEILYKCVTDLQKAYLPIIESKEFQDEY